MTKDVECSIETKEVQGGYIGMLHIYKDGEVFETLETEPFADRIDAQAEAMFLGYEESLEDC